MTIPILICLMIAIAIAIPWANAIDYMARHHRDYNGNDLFDER